MKITHKFIKYSVVILFAVTSVYALLISFRWGLANVWYFNASYYLTDWSKQQKIASKQDYVNALTAINNAVGYNPEHPHYYHIKGRIIDWGIYAGFEKKFTLNEVKASYISSLSLRQAWPETWIDLAQTNNALHHLSKETQTYIDKALYYGPYQQVVTMGTLSILMQNWSSLNTTQITLFYQQLAIALQQPRLIKKLFRQAKENNIDHLVCIQIKYNDKFKLNHKTWYYKKYCN